MTPQHKQDILNAIWGDCYTNVHAEVIFQNDGRLAKIERIEAILIKARCDCETLKALWLWQDNEHARINAQGDTE